MMKMLDINISRVWLFFLVIINGINMEISTSKIKNIIINIIKLVEKDVFFSDNLSNPHSNADFFSFLFSFFSRIIMNVTIRVIDRTLQKIVMFLINLFIF